MREDFLAAFKTGRIARLTLGAPVKQELAVTIAFANELGLMILIPRGRRFYPWHVITAVEVDDD